VDDPKVQTLGDKLGFFWVNCLCLSSQNGGRLPTIEQIAWRLHKTSPQVSSMVADLHAKGLLDQDEHGFMPHNWGSRQYLPEAGTSTERVKRFRETRKRHETGETNETRFTNGETGETFPDTDTDTEDKQKQSQKLVSIPLAPLDFESSRDRAWEWFKAEYPGDLNEDWDAQIFVSVIQTFEDIAILRTNLPIWMACDKWSEGFIEKAENFLRKRMFKSLPKSRDSPGRNSKPELPRLML